MRPLKRDKVIILFGAGASCDAGIPHSASMIEEVEKLVACADNQQWSEFRRLYHFVKSSIYFSDGIQGRFNNHVTYNIERLVNTLEEICKKRDHTLYPFVGSWSPTLVEVAGDDFQLVSKFRSEIVRKLRSQWIVLRDNNSASYFNCLEQFQVEYQHPLRIFTLNYDLCVEKNCSYDAIERGFNDLRLWDWRRYEESTGDPKRIYLYKLHGSTDWHYNSNGILTFSDEPVTIEDTDSAIIFGATYKLQYRDPFLFLAYEFRKWALESRLIVSVGYGFGDEHINRIILQALNSENQPILLSIAPFENDDEEGIKQMEEKISKTLGNQNKDQIKAIPSTAKDFLQRKLNLAFLTSFLPEEEEELFP